MRIRLASLLMMFALAVAACGDDDLKFGDANDTPTPDSTTTPSPTSTPTVTPTTDDI